jgi:ribosome-associated protein
VTFVTDTIWIAPGVSIPLGELEFRASRASGPGGQGVNTTDSRVELRFDVAGSPSLGEEERAMLLRELGRRIDANGVLRVVAQAHRSQLQNRRAAIERFRELLERALHQRASRVATKPSAAAVRRRLAAKRRRAATKQTRRPPRDEDD